MRLKHNEQNVRAKKDEKPKPLTRRWKTLTISIDGVEIAAMKAEEGHWIYFAYGQDDQGEEQWYKIRDSGLEKPYTFFLNLFIPQSPEEKKAKRKARRDKREAIPVKEVIEAKVAQQKAAKKKQWREQNGHN